MPKPLEALVAALALVSLSACGPQAESRRSPNILLIFADDLGWASLGSYGNTLVPTPHLDRLAAEGVRFTDAYATPQCTPSRAVLLSGQNTARHRMWHVIGWYGYPHARMTEGAFREQFPPDLAQLPHSLRKAGYVTGIFGKWHLTTGEGGGYNQLPPESADSFGFDHSPEGWDRDLLMPYDRAVDWLTERTLEFIGARRDQPFFAYLSHHTIHGVVAAPPALVAEYREKGYPEKGLNNATYLAALEHLDASVGRLLDRLDEWGIAENTIVVFTSDNGGVLRRYEHRDPVRDAAGVPVRTEINLEEFSNAPLRDGKGSAYEGGIRVPMILRWPGGADAGVERDTPVHLMDLLPTLLEAAGAPAPSDHAVDGLSLLPLLRGGDAAFPERALHWYLPLYDLNWGATPAAVIRRGDYKLIEHFGDRFDRDGNYVEGGAVELFDLSEDIGETNDLAGSEPELADELRDELRTWITEHELAIPTENSHYEPSRRFESTREKPPWLSSREEPAPR